MLALIYEPSRHDEASRKLAPAESYVHAKRLIRAEPAGGTVTVYEERSGKLIGRYASGTGLMLESPMSQKGALPTVNHARELASSARFRLAFGSVIDVTFHWSKPMTDPFWDDDDIKIEGMPENQVPENQVPRDAIERPPHDEWREPNVVNLEELSVDQLIDAYQFHANEERMAREFKHKIAALLAAKAPRDPDCRTARVRGEQFRAKIEFPADAWGQSKLKEAYNAYPQYRDEFLVIERLKVKLREYDKAIRETGPEPFQQFVQMLKSANRGPQGPAKITVEG
jgi:hypothetical protein